MKLTNKENQLKEVRNNDVKEENCEPLFMVCRSDYHQSNNCIAVRMDGSLLLSNRIVKF